MRIQLVSFLFLTTACSAINLPKLVDKTEPKVVKLGIVEERGRGTCSGSFISHDGLILTCAHCFGHETPLKVFIKTSDEVTYPGRLLAIDKTKDLALVAPDGVSLEVPFFILGNTPRIGQSVYSFGSPLGIQHVFEVGYVSDIITESSRLIIHSAFISPGNSGGPLVNDRGELIGVNEAIFMLNPFVPAQGLNIAIDQSIVKDFLRGLYVLPKR